MEKEFNLSKRSKLFTKKECDNWDKEFNLSEKRTLPDDLYGMSDGSIYWYEEEDVKELIRRLKKWNTKYVFGDISKDINKVINKLAGEELSK